MSRTPYIELLKRPEWQKKRLEVLEHAVWRCQLCGRKDMELHVHHSYYTKGKKPWQYPLGSMVALCKKHHSWLHDRERAEKYEAVYQTTQPTTPEPEPPKPSTPESENLDRQDCDDFIAAIRRQLLSEA